MLEQIEITNYKGIKNLKIDGFKHLNIFLGAPNTSKTSILESLYIALLRSPLAINLISYLRNTIRDDDILESLFYNYKINCDITFVTYMRDKSEYKIVLEGDLSDMSILPIVAGATRLNNIMTKLKFMSNKNNEELSYFNINIEYNNGIAQFNITPSHSKLYTNCSFIINDIVSLEANLNLNLSSIVQDNSKKELLNKYCREFDNRVLDIRFANRDKIVVELEGLEHTINIKSMGSGFQAYTSILSSILYGNNKYIFIDEIENGLHFDSIKKLFLHILLFSKKNDVQFFITTHNKELLQKLNEVLVENNYDDIISVYNVFHNKNNDVSAVNYTQENFNHAIEHNNEIRY